MKSCPGIIVSWNECAVVANICLFKSRSSILTNNVNILKTLDNKGDEVRENGKEIYHVHWGEEEPSLARGGHEPHHVLHTEVNDGGHIDHIEYDHRSGVVDSLLLLYRGVAGRAQGRRARGVLVVEVNEYIQT